MSQVRIRLFTPECCGDYTYYITICQPSSAICLHISTKSRSNAPGIFAKSRDFDGESNKSDVWV
jgi:hypothetical protein